MGEVPTGRRRVLIEDARHNGQHLRATWHPETRQFVVSTWRDDVCTGAVRVPAEKAAALAGLVVTGLAAAATPDPAPTRTPSPPGWAARALAWLRRPA
ncbi:MAG TPA: hypothetical protein VFB77_00075 [Acidimicrobiales bacterium]|nr:hypothetical protein [Acidimicrobiales bacterium]